MRKNRFRLTQLLPVGAFAAVGLAVVYTFTASPFASPAFASLAAPTQIEEPRLLPPPAVDLPRPARGGDQTAVFAGGCFWGVQGVFQHVKGVKSAVSGYAGGTAASAKYPLVSSGVTAHAEAVKIVYDPNVVSYGQLLRIFFSVATDPTQLNQQYPDDGPQYRNAIFAQNADQQRVAKAYIAQLDGAKAFRKKIVTTVDAAHPFYAAEAYHQDFLALNPRHGYIVSWDLPKIEALKTLFPSVYQATPVLVGRRG